VLNSMGYNNEDFGVLKKELARQLKLKN
jgi:hypothetical protein